MRGQFRPNRQNPAGNELRFPSNERIPVKDEQKLALIAPAFRGLLLILALLKRGIGGLRKSQPFRSKRLPPRP
jgi:hypothetical protein